MDEPAPPRGRAEGRTRPLDPSRLEELALAYVARFATSEARVRDYCRRKLRERGWHAEEMPDIDGLVARLAGAGYIDDGGFARGRAAALRRRGYGERRVEHALRSAGIGEEHRQAAHGGASGARRAALVMARKRGFGPFGGEALDRARRQKQIAAMLRAGHGLDTARELIDAPSETAALDWIGEAEPELPG